VLPFVSKKSVAVVSVNSGSYRSVMAELDSIFVHTFIYAAGHLSAFKGFKKLRKRL
jgi:hypothetical protein